ncbi:hypothetical protein JMJ77_0008807 [Colletotrichum scovillei]|uniref:Uncharacterized protein n=1 Tax=Colletotrichum scovillei TaxID=1209932 RepID=A0A9P7QR79_9PEZI|nr:hypothetical protein JMJ78_0001698 [Colletotrichum scovillei]KAG7041102.1 hypothetical protein JMJ77_0008807 [Colletotrichum scovillei]KAG7061135.1 hypothetical protein JMJ76_0010205 [Colletotrichum scovillei]
MFDMKKAVITSGPPPFTIISSYVSRHCLSRYRVYQLPLHTSGLFTVHPVKSHLTPRSHLSPCQAEVRQMRGLAAMVKPSLLSLMEWLNADEGNFQLLFLMATVAVGAISIVKGLGLRQARATERDSELRVMVL